MRRYQLDVDTAVFIFVSEAFCEMVDEGFGGGVKGKKRADEVPSSRANVDNET